MGFGPVIVSKIGTGRDLEVVYRFATSIEDESSRSSVLLSMFKIVGVALGIVRERDLNIIYGIEPWSNRIAYPLPGTEVSLVSELTRQAEIPESYSTDLVTEYNWHEIIDEPTPHDNIVYEARLYWS